MRVQKKVSIGGEWAKIGKHINDGDRIKLLDAGQIVSGEFGDRHVFHILTLKKEELNLSFNQTSMNNLIEAWGEDTDNWANRVVKAFVVRQMVGDGLKNVAYIAPEDWTMNEDGKFVNPNKVEDAPKEKDYPPMDETNDTSPF